MKRVKIKELFDIRKGKKAEEVDNSDLRYIQIEDLRDNENIKFCSISDSNVLCNKDDILIAWDGANAGTVGFGVEGVIGSTIARLRPKTDDFGSDYIGLLLQSKFDFFQRTATGATIPHISRKALENLEIPLPSLSEQKAIVAKLDRAQRLIDIDKEMLAKYDELIQSVFLDMFGDPVSNPKDLKISTIGVECDVKGGKRVPKGQKLQKEKNKHPYIKAQNIKNGQVTLDDLEYLSEDLANKLSRYTVEKGTVCITVVGANIGDIGLVPDKLHMANLTENANKLLIKDQDRLNNIYLAHYMMTDYVKKQIYQRTMAVGVPKLAIFRIKQIKIPIPSIELQNRFSSYLQKFELLKSETKKSLKNSEELFSSLVQGAFG